MTLFDVILVALLAVVTVLGARQGWIGLFWGLGSLILIWVVNVFGLGLLFTVPVAFILGMALLYVLSRSLSEGYHPLASVAGGIGGFMFGIVLIAAIVLSFPISYKSVAGKNKVLYPSVGLPAAIYKPVAHSQLQRQFSGIWASPQAVRNLIIPDWQ